MARRKIPEREFEAITEAISIFPEGVAFEKLLTIITLDLPRRTIQNRVSSLVKKGVLIAQGKTKGMKYRLAVGVASTVPAEETVVPLTPESKYILRKISMPTVHRKHTAYNREFLYDYTPNVTQYLSTALCEHLHKTGRTDGERPAGTYARQIFGRLLIDLTWNSSRLEGNTYSLLETERLLELSEMAEGKNLKETQMILNHKAAIEFLVECIDRVGINRYTLLNLHALLSQNLLSNSSACGRLRSIPVGIGESVYHPLAVPQLIEESFDQILVKGQAIKDPFEQAFFLMVHIPYLQPFEDVNKRVSRLAANIPLIRANIAPLSFVEVPESSYINGLLGIYELNRIDYFRDVFVWAYERSANLYSTTRNTLGEPDPLRLRYRELIYNTIAHIVLEVLDKKTAVAFIKKQAEGRAKNEDQAKVITAIENELRGLHEGNIARYQIRPSQYEAWAINWK
ncbi:MAG: Fic family protein [Verrucomicrobia bacterium]|nr:Fic family protein [Verrucomicrobiota bacterium]